MVPGHQNPGDVRLRRHGLEALPDCLGRGRFGIEGIPGQQGEIRPEVPGGLGNAADRGHAREPQLCTGILVEANESWHE